MIIVYKITLFRHQRKAKKEKVLVLFLSNLQRERFAGQVAVTFMQAWGESLNS